jgi:hypothetical protein
VRPWQARDSASSSFGCDLSILSSPGFSCPKHSQVVWSSSSLTSQIAASSPYGILPRPLQARALVSVVVRVLAVARSDDLTKRCWPYQTKRKGRCQADRRWMTSSPSREEERTIDVASLLLGDRDRGRLVTHPARFRRTSCTLLRASMDSVLGRERCTGEARWMLRGDCGELAPSFLLLDNRRLP